MKNRNRRIALVAILLAVSIGNFFRISSEAANIRTVDFLSIFVIGALAGLLIGILTSPRQKE
jgi:hypothetical protein